MAKQLLGTVNEYGKEALEGCYAKGKVVFENKDIIKEKALVKGSAIWRERVVTWTAWMIVPNEYGPKAQKDYQSVGYENQLTGEQGD